MIEHKLLINSIILLLCFIFPSFSLIRNLFALSRVCMNLLEKYVLLLGWLRALTYKCQRNMRAREKHVIICDFHKVSYSYHSCCWQVGINNFLSFICWTWTMSKYIFYICSSTSWDVYVKKLEMYTLYTSLTFSGMYYVYHYYCLHR